MKLYRSLCAFSVSVFFVSAIYACSSDSGSAPTVADSGPPPAFDAGNNQGDAADAAVCAPAQYTWATSGGGPGQYDAVHGVAVDGDGNTWIVGTFIGDATWGDSVLTATDKVHTTGFFAKLDSAGKVLFAHALPGSSVDPSRVRLDGAGNAYVVGTFEDKLDVDDVHLTGQANGSMYVLAIDPSGKAKWGVGSSNIGGSREEGYDLALDATGDVYVAGSYNGRLQLGTLSVPANATTSDQAIFVARYSPAKSQWLWVQGWAGTEANSGGEAHAIALAPDGSIYAGGTIENDVDFREGHHFTAATGSFLVKLAPADGHVLWATDIAPPTDQANVAVRAATTDTAGNLYVTGSYTASATFAAPGDAGAPLTVAVTATGQDMFIAKYDPSGTPTWVKHGGNGNGNTRADDIAFDGANGLYVGGFHQGPTVFDSQTLSRSGDLFVARYDLSGAIQWVQGNDNASHGGGEALGIAVPSATRGVYIGGAYDTDTTLGAFQLKSAGQDDALVARMCN
jgi:hypothetical protein